MIISHKINQHLDRLEEHLVEAVQGDSGRELAMHLYYQNATWTPPEGTKALVRYASDQGYGGCYDTLPDGTAAWSIAENVLTVRLVPQVLAVPGIARMQVLLRHGEEAVATFSVLIRVQADPSADAMEPDGYVNLSQWIAEEVATQVTDAVAPPAVYVMHLEGGSADCTFADLENAWRAHQGICCCYEDMILWVQRMVMGTFCVFSGVREGELITVTMNQGGHVSVQKESFRGANADQLCVYKTVRPSFAWIDDDGKEKVQYLYQWAMENGVPFTSALISGWIDQGKKGWMTVERVKELYDSGMVTFASHTQNHVKLSDANRETVEAELKNSKEQIESWGVPCEVMVYPNGAINDADLDIVHKYFPFGFLASGQYDDNNIPNTNRVNTSPISTYKLMRVDVRGDYTEENGGIAYVKGQIDDAIAKNGLLVLMSHVGSTVIYDENGNATNTYLDASADLAVYTEILEYIRGKGYDIEPIMDVCQRFVNPVDVKDFAVGVDGNVAVKSGNVHIVAPYNVYSMATVPSQYPQNQVVSCQIYDTAAPENAMGILTAYVTNSLAYRTYMPKTSNTLYLQVKNANADAWMDWSKCNQKDYTRLSNNKILSTTIPSALPSGVSICIVASATDIANLPEGVQGLMTAYNLFADTAKAREEWQPNGSNKKYVRYAASASAWNPWYVLTPTLYQP